MTNPAALKFNNGIPQALATTGDAFNLVHGRVANICNFGASSAANAATNTAAMQAAAAYIQALGGGIVYFPAGSYLISVPGLRFNNYKGVTFKGEGKFASTLVDAQGQANAGQLWPAYSGNPTGTRGFLCFDTCTRCHVRDLGFIGAGIWQQQAGQSAIDRLGVYYRTSAVDCSVTDCYFELLEGEVCVTDGVSTRCHWDRNTYYRCLVNMVNPGGGPGSCIDCTANDNVITSPGSSALLLNGADGFQYMRNVHRQEAGYKYGSDLILPSQSTGVVIQDNIIADFEWSAGSCGMRLGADFQPGNMGRISATRNTFRNCFPLGVDGGFGVDASLIQIANAAASASYAYFYVGYNEFIECGQSSQGAYGFAGASAIRVSGSRPLTNSIIEYNRVFNGAGAAHPLLYGLDIAATVPSNNTLEVHHNDFEDCATPYRFGTRPAFVGSRIPFAGKGVVYTAYPGSPENNVTASIGSYCADTTNGEGYIKKTGSGNTGWKLVTHA